MLIIGLGDLATRMRAAFGLRGRIPTQLDDTVVPTVLTMDMTDRLFADNPQYFIVRGFQGGNAVNPGWFEMNCFNANTRVAVDQIILANTQVGANIVNVYLIRGSVPAAGTNQPSIALNKRAPTTQGVMVDCEFGTAVVNLGTGRLIWSASIAVGGQVTLPIGAVLYPGDSFLCIASGVAAANTVEVTCFGREFLST